MELNTNFRSKYNETHIRVILFERTQCNDYKRYINVHGDYKQMKKHTLFLFLLLVSMTAIISCNDDIINSDDNINKTNKTIIEYDYVLANQDSSVIMPLRAGNKWIYNITDYDGKGGIKSQRLDSIMVLKDSIINNEKWFYVWNPIVGNGNVMMTNTDAGLWLKCPYCGNKPSYLEAQYPLSANPYYIGELNFVFADKGWKLLDTAQNWIRYESAVDFKVPAGTFNSIKYTNWVELKVLKRTIDPFRISYYAPNIGLVRLEVYIDIYNPVLNRVYELISYDLGG